MKFQIGDRVRKTNSEQGDAHADGALGIVIARIDMPAAVTEELLKTGKRAETQILQVIWDDLPDIPVFVTGSRLEKGVVE